VAYIYNLHLLVVDIIRL